MTMKGDAEDAIDEAFKDSIKEHLIQITKNAATSTAHEIETELRNAFGNIKRTHAKARELAAEVFGGDGDG
jgi:hypothetical protein